MAGAGSCRGMVFRDDPLGRNKVVKSIMYFFSRKIRRGVKCLWFLYGRKQPVGFYF